MAYTETTRTTYGQRMKKSFGGIGSGFVLLIIGTILLWWNEGRAVKTTKMLNEAAGVTVEMTDINTVDPQFEGELVHATGMTATIDSLIDPDFGIGVTAVKFIRKVEYYQWVERSQSKTKDKVGGGQETTTTYTYEKKWVDSPVNSDEFHDPEYQGANRVRIAVDDLRQTAENVTFGAYRLTKSQIASISGEQPYLFSEKDTERITKELFKEECLIDTTLTVKIQGNVISFGQKSGTPQVGDVRVTFTKVLPAEVSLMAQVSGDTFVPYTSKNGKNFDVLQMGTQSADQMYEGQHSANKLWLWILRLLGIFLVIGGLKGIFGFLETLAKVVPFIANIIGAGVGLVCSLVGFAWSFIVIAIAWLAYRPVLGISLIVIAIALIIFLSRKKKVVPAAEKALGVVLALTLSLSVNTPAQGQNLLNQLGKRAKNAATTRTTMGVDRAIQKGLDKVEGAIEKGTNDALNGRGGKGQAPAMSNGRVATGANGTIYYVSESGNNKNDGLSPTTPLKNIQKALDIAPAGSTIYVAAGNYYGLLRCGNIFVRKPVYIYGGFNGDFSQRDILNYRTMVQPTPESNGTAKAPTVQLEVNVGKYDNNLEYRNADVLFDGIIFDRGNSISYYSGNDENQKGQPEGVETTKMNPIGTKGMGGADLSNLETYTKETCILYLNNSNVNLTVHNCAFINAPNHVILGLFRGSMSIDNNIFVNCRMEAMDVRGSDPKVNSRVDFTNNTLLFMWSFKQNLETMGYGFRFQPGTDCYLANNIFGCSMMTALDYTHIDSDRNREATRKTRVEDNVFFLNRMGDISIPGGGNFINISSADFSDVEYLDSESGNTTVKDANIFKGKIDEAYLKGFLNASYSAEMQHNPNSAVNTFRSALGMNQIGTMTSKVTMYANRYNWEKALLLFGAMPGYGAQMPR